MSTKNTSLACNREREKETNMCNIGGSLGKIVEVIPMLYKGISLGKNAEAPIKIVKGTTNVIQSDYRWQKVNVKNCNSYPSCYINFFTNIKVIYFFFFIVI